MIKILLLCSLFPFTLLADETDLIVRGNGVVKSEPDQVNLSFSIETKDKSAKASQAQNTKLSENVLATLKKKFKLPENKIQTSYYRIEPSYNYQNNNRKLEGYSVSHGINVTISPVDQLGPILDALTQDGITHIQSINFSLTKQQEVYRQALAKAIEDATAKAQIMAKAAGKKLGRLEQLQETGTTGPVPIFAKSRGMMAAAAMESSAPSIEAGELSTTADVQMIFELN